MPIVNFIFLIKQYNTTSGNSYAVKNFLFKQMKQSFGKNEMERSVGAALDQLQYFSTWKINYYKVVNFTLVVNACSLYVQWQVHGQK